MVKRHTLALFLIAAFALPSPAEGKDPAQEIVIMASPSICIPLGDAAQYFGIGGSMAFTGEFPIRPLPILVARGGFAYNFTTLQASETLSILSVSAGPGLRFSLAPRLGASLYGVMGYNYGFVNETEGNGGSGYYSLGAGLSLALAPDFALGVSAAYSGYFGMFSSVDAGLTASYRFSPPPRASTGIRIPTAPRPGNLGSDGVLEISSLSLGAVFPILLKHYDDHPIGTMTIRNGHGLAVTDITVAFIAREYMAAPKERETGIVLAPGESQDFDIYALFSNEILEVTEATKATAEISIRYRVGGEERSARRSETLRIHDRNALIWDDDRKAAAFVTAKDPVVLGLSNGALAYAREIKNRSLRKNLLAAMAVHESLRALGIAYVSDPRIPFASRDGEAVDYLKFPRQTLEYGAGDCDDLAVLYCAALESVGVETAFVTVPGHIFMAASLDLSADEARKTFARPDELILLGGKAWLPIETTERKGGFLAAWAEAAREWNENSLKKSAVLIPTHEAWTLYQPVGLPGVQAGPAKMPDKGPFLSALETEIAAFVAEEIGPREKALKALAQKSQGGAAPLNSLGVLYARYGLLDRAEQEFAAIIRKSEFVPALINLGNVLLLREETEKSLEYYERALKKDPKSSAALLNAARANHALKNYSASKKLMDRLRTLDPALAAAYAFLDLRGQEAARASESSGVGDEVLWSEEPR